MSGAVIYLLGFVGLISIGLIPLRSWRALTFEYRRISQRRSVAFSVVALVAAGAIWSDVQITARIFRCLTESYCGPSIASGWTYLAMLGVVYIAFEVVIVVVQKIGRAKEVKPGV